MYAWRDEEQWNIFGLEPINPSHKSEPRKNHDTSGAKAHSFSDVFGTAEAVPS